MERCEPHALTVEFDSSDHTQTLLRFAADLHRRRITITALSFTVPATERVRIDAEFIATGRQALTAQRTLQGRIGVLRTALRVPV
ncbi:hypothetical protein [Mycobacterium aquaticum]|uniref:ACT domain-containing protein n=1 Tax=Mycobacterium aquaticum TaxID=1927124 RepID=A0A1X0AB95_9MYCO|nr:hypothetical protein [Mycobacterium aquaticum]ORA27282.1 hypothetical protein BST13_30635 [Mycobacterium aquaticum]